MKFFHEEIKPKWDHYAYTLKHKWNLIGPGREMGLGWGTILKHDLDKLWDLKLVDAYSDYLFSPQGKSGRNDPEVYKRFRESAQKHYERSPHHFHKLPHKDQPDWAKRERPADVYSLLRTTGQTKLPFNDWYKQNKGKFF